MTKKEKKREQQARYRASPKGKACMAKYRASGKRPICKAKYDKSEKGKEKNRINATEYRKGNKVKTHARSQAKYYILLTVCSIEECDERGERHHEDYNKPLDVTSLCSRHHVEHHSTNRMADKL